MSNTTSGRIVTLVAVQNGQVYTVSAGGSIWWPAIQTTSLATSGVVRSAANNQKLWFADGASWLYYDPSTNLVNAWTASQGSLPGSNLMPQDFPRLIATWRGRTCLSGIATDPQNWFFSAVNDPTNWNYSAVLPSGQFLATAAVAGNNPGGLGLIGDVVTAICPFNDDLLIMGGDHSIWAFNGDPLYGGQINTVSNNIGMAWGSPWCVDPYQNLYFVSNRMGIYVLTPGSQPQRISQQIEQLLVNVDLNANLIRLEWNDRWQQLHVWITPVASAQATTHLCWEQRTGAWWQDQFGNNNHNPLCCTTVDGNAPGARYTVIGSWDGYARAISPTAANDDGTAVSSSVVLGPLTTPDFDAHMIKEIQGILATGSGNVTWAVYVGPTAEAALASSAIATGTFAGGRSLTFPVRATAHALWVKLTATTQWALEGIRTKIAALGGKPGLGKVQGRQIQP